MAKGRKSESSRLNLFYILQVLAMYSDAEHPMSASEIKEKADVEFGYMASTDSIISLDTVKRTLEELIERVFAEGIDQTEASYRYGYMVSCVMKKEESFLPYRCEEGKQAPKKYYYYENSLKEAEIRTLKDAIETYSYFSEEDITDIVRKLVRLRPRSFPKNKYFDVAKNDRDEDSLLLMNIDYLNTIIQHRNGAMITYCAYDIDKKLKARYGFPKYVEPLHLMWSNGYYYLVTYNERYQNTLSYRVDRITDIEEVEIENTHRVESFNPVQYRHEHPIMFGGNKEKIVLLCRDTGRNYIMNTIMDVFGKNAKVSKADKGIIEKYLPDTPDYYEKQGITWLKVSIESTKGGVELWATQYCNDCLIIEPEASAKRVKERLLTGLNYYN